MSKEEDFEKHHNDPTRVWEIGNVVAMGTEEELRGMRRKKCTHEHVSRGVCLTCEEEVNE